MLTDAQYLVQLEENERKIRKEEEQDNLVRKVAKEIAGSEVCILQLQDVNKYCKTARNHVRRLRSLGFRVSKNKLTRVKDVFGTWFVSEWVVTLP
jgi:hypothetical protein